ncbi:MAG: hypothetical protein MJ141_03645, partial [Clostridia bacterium]|nr:hypothetical protein [Clostridia bacterium]
LLDRSMRETARLHPTRVSITLSMEPLSTAVIHLPGSEPQPAVDEIAEELKMNPETVKSRLRRSRARLKTTLLERGYELED